MTAVVEATIDGGIFLLNFPRSTMQLVTRLRDVYVGCESAEEMENVHEGWWVVAELRPCPAECSNGLVWGGDEPVDCAVCAGRGLITTGVGAMEVTYVTRHVDDLDGDPFWTALCRIGHLVTAGGDQT